jgi:glycosyltransferase involved in cell wall biosynthesis
MSKINILYYEPSSGFGGSSHALANLTNNLDKKIFTPIIVIKNYGPQIEKIKNAEILKLKDYKESAKLSNLKFLIYFITKLLPEAVKIYLIIKKKKVSLIHVNTNIISGIPVIIASKVYGIPCICHIRQTRELIKRERIFARWLDKFIVLNTKAYEIYKKDIPEEKICIIYDGIGLDNFREVQSDSFRREVNLDSSPVIGLVGRIVRGKGHREFALSVKEVLKIKPDIKFAIVGDTKGGDDKYYKEVKELVERENLKKDIIFTGWRNDIEDVIGSFDILVQPATSPEGFGLTVIEAMALRKPVIATNVPGPSDIIVDGETGFLVPPGDIKVMAERIIYLLDNPQVAKRMGEAGRKRVEQLFNIQDTVKKIQELYLQVLNR